MSDDTIEVVVEIPKGSRNKCEFDHEQGVMRLDRRLFSATVYPADYGFIEGTLAEDGDPLDALIPAFGPDLPRLPRDGSATRGFWMEDEKGPRRQDHRGRGWRPDYEDVGRIDDLPRHLLDEIEHFFEIYKDLEPGKSSSTAGFEGLQAARKEIAEAQSRAG